MRNGPHFTCVWNKFSTLDIIDTETGICTALKSDFYERISAVVNHQVQSQRCLICTLYKILCRSVQRSVDWRLNTADIGIWARLKLDIYFRFILETSDVDGPQFWVRHMQNLVNRYRIADVIVRQPICYQTDLLTNTQTEKNWKESIQSLDAK